MLWVRTGVRFEAGAIQRALKQSIIGRGPSAGKDPQTATYFGLRLLVWPEGENRAKSDLPIR